ncbi:NAD(P)-dependent dehydrogenase (short-subunit alcohol dehydrogenase family) [Nitrosospira sp. Nsp5]|uniref:NAD(P)-dependent dehydrogenase, short-chain alcohol dehydrogenase family n=1 Tax=Nitrosospira multiformis TaxID=1231 RepID=A0ABY0TJU1_9PROT|nr:MULTISPECIES: SDR family oxidoreductase [Nitrosospira]PTR10216.1 NAD(P)-dependent dehydrogenase (short-subunit alcohol dehydrogenase family) [Nitrosospira sp. Nsp5]SDQ94941.1 NAD(P)-dependent dehydrogenase, short-chain alcohol dehydrogenase family [Nitrosospira multiformis]
MKPVCLITGAGGRLGQDLCHALQEDYDLVATYRSTIPDIPSQFQQPLEGTAGGAEEPENESALNGVPAYLVQADLTRREDVKRVVEVALARYGRIDALINTAADIKFHGNLRDLWQANDYPQSQMLLNSIVPMQLASAIYQYCWRDQPDENTRWNRSVVNISSISGLYVFEERGQAFYGVSKAALNMLTLYLSLELAPHGVRVNAICPSRFTGKAATRRVTEAIRNLLTGDSTGTIVTKVP